MAHPDMIQFLNTLSLTGMALYGLGMLGAGLALGYLAAMRVFQSRMRKGAEMNQFMPVRADLMQRRAAEACAVEMIVQAIEQNHHQTIH